MPGSVQEKNGRLYLALHKKVDGKYVNKSIPTGLKAHGNLRKAEIMLKEALEKWDEVDINYSEMLFDKYLEYWLSEYEKTVRPNTYLSVKGSLVNHAIPYFSKKALRLIDVDAVHLNEYYSYLGKCERKDGRSGNISASTIKHHHRNLSNALSYAVEHGFIKHNPATSAKPPQAKKYIGESLDFSDVSKFYEYMENSPIKVPLFLIAFFGLRRSEATGLKWECIDFKKREITIKYAAIEKSGTGVILAETKTDKSRRTLPMSEFIYDLLIDEKNRQDMEAIEYAEYHQIYNPEGFVCVHKNGTQVTPNYLSRNFKKIMREAGLPEIRLHDMRHTVASILLDKGYSVKEVQEWLGHSNPTTTLDTYSHVINKEAKRNMASTLMTGSTKAETIAQAYPMPQSPSEKVIDLTAYRKAKA